MCVGLAHLVLWRWFSSVPPQFLGCLAVLVPGVCVCSLLSVVFYTRISAVNDETSTSTRDLCILYITLIARKLSKPDDGRYRLKHVVLYC